MSRNTLTFNEETSSKLPALTLLTNLGYRFIPPSECAALRSSRVASTHQNTHQVILLPVLRAFLGQQTFPFAGQQHSLSAAAIDKIIHELTPAMNLGLQAANEKIYNALIYGVGVTEFINGKKASPTIKLIDWQHSNRNQYHL